MREPTQPLIRATDDGDLFPEFLGEFIDVDDVSKGLGVSHPEVDHHIGQVLSVADSADLHDSYDPAEGVHLGQDADVGDLPPAESSVSNDNIIELGVPLDVEEYNME